ncbi:MAG: sugar phosphate nucleotidyltransferase [bacterium]
MKIIIFAGGIGTRLWPLSRKNSPKQFDKIFDGKSTLELAIARVEPLVGIDNIFVQTTENFKEAIRTQVPNLPSENIFIEPCRRNVGPAVCYGMMRLRSRFPLFQRGVEGDFSAAGTMELVNEGARDGADDNKAIRAEATGVEQGLRAEKSPRLPCGQPTPFEKEGNPPPIPQFANNRPTLEKGVKRRESVALLWADHLMERVDEFRNALLIGDELIMEDPMRFIFLAERPRFANNNLGWIKVGEKISGNDKKDAMRENEYFKFLGWKYKPEISECDQMFKSGDYFWNPGYFVSSIDFILCQYKNLAPEIYENVKNSIEYPEKALEHYERAEKVSFDRAIIEKTDFTNAVVVKTNMGWSDPGTLYALKEALEKSRDANVVNGNVVELNTKDSLLYNFEKKKVLTTVGLDGFVVINTKDALIVAPKEEVVNVTKLVEKIGELGMEKYL